MLYIVGGAALTGKSLLVHRLLAEKPMPSIPLDLVRASIFAAMPPDKRPATASERTRLLQPAVRSYVRGASHFVPDLALEGDDVLPATISRAARRHEIELRAVFFGRSRVDIDELIELESTSPHKWLHLVDASEHRALANGIRRHSRRVEAQCLKYDFTYIDLSAHDFDTAQQLGIDTLLG